MKREDVMRKVQDIFREIFDDDELVISEDTTADDIEDWDSFEHINLVIAMEKEFSVKFPMKKVVVLNNVGEMIDLILESI